MRCRTLVWLWQEVQLEVTRQSQHSGPSEGIGKSTEKPVYFNVHAAKYADSLQKSVINWTLGCGRAATPDRLYWLSDNVFHLLRVEGAIANCYTELTNQIIAGMKIIDQPPRVYLGDCPACHGELFGNPEEETQTCHTCKINMPTAELRADTRVRAREMYVTPREAQRVLGMVYEVQITEGRIAQWKRRGKVRPVLGNRYLVADLLEAAEECHKLSYRR